MMKEYQEFSISFLPFNVDLISGLIWNLPIEGIIEETSSLKVFALVEKNISEKDFENLLTQARKENLIESFIIASSTVENKNWNEEWEKRIQVIKVTDKIVIKPSFRNYLPKNDEFVITIDPKMSFGTGEHETTKLMLGFVQKYIFAGAKVLDVGSGTAVLSIASAMFGAEKVTAIDNDELCLENGIENVKVNNVEKIVDVKHLELQHLVEDNFDIILANINKHILLELSNEMPNKIKKNGRLILSGLLISDESDIINDYSLLGFHFIEKKHLNEWSAIVFEAKI